MEFTKVTLCVYYLDELASMVQEAEAKAPEDLTEEDKMALLGRPKAGDVVRAQIRIKESKEFKVSTFALLHLFPIVKTVKRHFLSLCTTKNIYCALFYGNRTKFSTFPYEFCENDRDIRDRPKQKVE